MLGVEDEGNVQRPSRCFGGLDAVEHPKEVGRVVQRAVGRHHFFSLAQPVVDGHDHGDLRGQVIALAHVGVVRIVFLIGVVEAERRDRGTQHFHRRGRRGDAAQQIDNAHVKAPGERKLRLELAQLELAGKNAVPQQAGSLLEGGVHGQLVNVDAPIGQDAGFSVDPADTGVRRDNSLQTLSSDSSRHRPRLSLLLFFYWTQRLL